VVSQDAKERQALLAKTEQLQKKGQSVGELLRQLGEKSCSIS
jgi:hypothetical protein